MTTGYTLWHGASSSLTDIYIYTHGKWGEAQADKYLNGFYACFDRIVSKQENWRTIPVEFEVDGYFTRYEKHYVYWKLLPDGNIMIVAILHERMHQVGRLQSAFE